MKLSKFKLTAGADRSPSGKEQGRVQIDDCQSQDRRDRA